MQVKLKSHFLFMQEGHAKSVYIQIILLDFTCYNLMHINMNKPKGNTHYPMFHVFSSFMTKLMCFLNFYVLLLLKDNYFCNVNLIVWTKRSSFFNEVASANTLFDTFSLHKVTEYKTHKI